MLEMYNYVLDTDALQMPISFLSDLEFIQSQETTRWHLIITLRIFLAVQNYVCDDEYHCLYLLHLFIS